MGRKFKKRFITILLAAALLVLMMDTAVLAAPEQFGQEEEEVITTRMNDAVMGLTMPDLGVGFRYTEMAASENIEPVKSGECAYFLDLEDNIASRVPMRTEGNEIIAYGDVVTTTLGNTVLFGSVKEKGSVDYCINGNMYKGISGDTWFVVGQTSEVFTSAKPFAFNLGLEPERFAYADEFVTGDQVQKKRKYFDKIVVGDGSAVLECTDISYLNSCLAEKYSLTGKSVENTMTDVDSLKKLQWNVWHPDSLAVQYTYGSFSNKDISTVSVSYNRFMSRLEEIVKEEQEKAVSIWEMPETSTNGKETNAGLFKEIDGVIFWYNSSTGQWVSEEDLEYGLEFDF